ncbi:hypothetical protein THAOC_07121, partial [Thalassiosira oceanica]
SPSDLVAFGLLKGARSDITITGKSTIYLVLSGVIYHLRSKSKGFGKKNDCGTMAVTPHSSSEVRPFSSRGLYYDNTTRLTAIAESPELLGAEIDHRIQPHRPRLSAAAVPMTIALARICNRDQEALRARGSARMKVGGIGSLSLDLRRDVSLSPRRTAVRRLRGTGHQKGTIESSDSRSRSYLILELPLSPRCPELTTTAFPAYQPLDPIGRSAPVASRTSDPMSGRTDDPLRARRPEARYAHRSGRTDDVEARRGRGRRGLRGTLQLAYLPGPYHRLIRTPISIRLCMVSAISAGRRPPVVAKPALYLLAYGEGYRPAKVPMRSGLQSTWSYANIPR